MYVALANLTNGGLSGGARKYLDLLVPLLARHPAVSRLDLFVPPRAVARLQQNSPFNWETWHAHDAFTGFRRLSAELKRRRPDVVFIPTTRWLDCSSIPVVVMVRNMEPLVVPWGENPWLETLRLLGLAWSARRVCQRATRVIAVSGFVRQHLEQRWGIASNKLATIYHGIDLPTSPYSTEVPSALRKVSIPFLLTAGSIRPYRRLEDVIQSLSLVSQRRLPIPLVVAGGVDSGMDYYLRQLKALAARLGVERQIVWAGTLNSSELSWCYTHCESFVMSSQVEACPNTVLEAMAHGCVSVSTDAAPMPEIFGDCASFYQSQQPEHLAEQLLHVLSLSPNERLAIHATSRQRASAFTWQRTADLTVQELVNATGSATESERMIA